MRTANQTAPVRSINPDDYQNIPSPVAAMQKPFADATETGWHDHRRHQLIYAATGTMRIDTRTDSWIVPSARALFMPSRVTHNVRAFGHVDMCTLYIEPAATPQSADRPFVILLTTLLRELIAALLGEPMTYVGHSRGGLIAALILDEIARGKPINLNIPMPRDQRLLRVCNKIIEDPSEPLSIDSLAETAGASARTLTRLFRTEVAMSLSEWRQQVRFHFALGAIARGEPIGKVAANCGYRSSSAFAAAFRKSFGVPPSRIAAQ